MTYEDPNAAQSASDFFTNSELDNHPGKPITVVMAEVKEVEDHGGGGSGSYGGSDRGGGYGGGKGKGKGKGGSYGGGGDRYGGRESGGSRGDHRSEPYGRR